MDNDEQLIGALLMLCKHYRRTLERIRDTQGEDEEFLRALAFLALIEDKSLVGEFYVLEEH